MISLDFQQPLATLRDRATLQHSVSNRWRSDPLVTTEDASQTTRGPLMSEERTRRIQDRAHALWEQEGHPHGRDAQHWSQAEREIAAEDDAQASGMSGPTTERRARKPKPVPGEAEKAPKARQGRAANAKTEAADAATPKTRGRKPKALAEDGAEAPKATRARKAKADPQEATASSTTARGRKSKAAVAEETTDPGAELAQEPSVVAEAPDKAE
ncbi:DUF2934 domain-containing protein [Paracoccus actinidiae]|uniref:DUF2934 domain-containing protein n=1 Tax=Paracoccus actinidiae TaxID=3064531 RepID=UPI0027D22BD0|nr:DUF2934 domain-containing protein [Paracoccus sp. M09]